MTDTVSASPAAEPPVALGHERLRLTGRFAGLWLDVDLEPTLAQWRLLALGKTDSTITVLHNLVTAWNLTDKSGRALKPSEVPDWLELTLAQIEAIVAAFDAAIMTASATPLVKTSSSG